MLRSGVMFKYIQTLSNEHMRFLARILFIRDSKENHHEDFLSNSVHIGILLSIRLTFIFSLLFLIIILL
jgi:hypothetical protein